VLDERFPLHESNDPGITLLLDLRREGNGEANLEVRMGRTPGERTCLLGWLDDPRTASDVERQENALLWNDEDLSRRISHRTGLLEELVLDSPEKQFRMHLRSAELDVELPAELFVPPREALDQPEDLELSRQLVHIPADSLRRLAYERAGAWLTRTKSDSDERARTDWREALDALHDPILEATRTRMDADLGAKIAQAAEHLREERVRDPSDEHLATLTEELGKSRANLEAMLAKVLEKQLEGLALPDSVSREELLRARAGALPRALGRTRRRPAPRPARRRARRRARALAPPYQRKNRFRMPAKRRIAPFFCTRNASDSSTPRNAAWHSGDSTTWPLTDSSAA
jgi:hypothetical protein